MWALSFVPLELKDYYTVLGVDPGASQDEIKRSFRQMAQQFHPDKNQLNPYAKAWFSEILEAYETLSDKGKKDDWLQKRWLMQSMGRPLKKPYALVPSAIVLEARHVRKHLDDADPFRTNHQEMAEEVLKVLTDEKMNMLKAFDYTSMNHEIVTELMAASQHLQYDDMPQVVQKLKELAAASPELRQKIDKLYAEKKWEKSWQKWQPWVLLIASMAICIIIYLIAR